MEYEEAVIELGMEYKITKLRRNCESGNGMG